MCAQAEAWFIGLLKYIYRLSVSPHRDKAREPITAEHSAGRDNKHIYFVVTQLEMIRRRGPELSNSIYQSHSVSSSTLSLSRPINAKMISLISFRQSQKYTLSHTDTHSSLPFLCIPHLTVKHCSTRTQGIQKVHS